MYIDQEIYKINDTTEIVLKSATVANADSLLHHRFITSGETHYMARYPEECETDPERIRKQLREFADSEMDFTVTAFVDGEVVGDLGVSRLRSYVKYAHRAYMGISIQEKYCGCGLGSRMVQIAVEQAKRNGFEQLELGVFSDNERAIRLYSKMGFQKCGAQPRAFKLKDGTYCDEILMIKFL